MRAFTYDVCSNLGVSSSIYMSASYEEFRKSWKKWEQLGKSGKKW